jgi:hypothetical protein
MKKQRQWRLLKCLRAIRRHMFLISLIFLKELLFAWRSEYGLANIKDTSLASQKKIEIGNLLMALLKQELITLEAIAKAASDPVWLAKQRADSLAVFFGVMHDKNIKKIEALNGARNTD